MAMGRLSAGSAIVPLCGALILTGCAQASPVARPTIGSPSASASVTQTREERTTRLAQEWDLTGSPLPNDWPDIPLPRGTEVVSAYAIGAEPRRTWTATFTTTAGSALDLAEPIIEALRERDYVPIAKYVGAEETNTGLYSFAAPTFAIYVVLGEDQGQPNLVITVRGSSDESTAQAEPSPGLDPRIEPQEPSSAATAPAATPRASARPSPPA